MTEYTYDTFGAVTATNPAFPNQFQFTGRENDGLAGLYYYRARFYHPGLQRFISEDPLGLAGGTANFYSYALNNPLAYVDPLGQQELLIGGRGGAYYRPGPFRPFPSQSGPRPGPVPRPTTPPQPCPTTAPPLPSGIEVPPWMRALESIMKLLGKVGQESIENPPTLRGTLPPQEGTAPPSGSKSADLPEEDCGGGSYYDMFFGVPPPICA